MNELWIAEPGAGANRAEPLGLALEFLVGSRRFLRSLSLIVRPNEAVPDTPCTRVFAHGLHPAQAVRTCQWAFTSECGVMRRQISVGRDRHEPREDCRRAVAYRRSERQALYNPGRASPVRH